MPPTVTFYGQNAQNSMFAVAPPQTPLRELTAPPDPLVVLKGLFVRGEGDERKGRERPGTPNILA